MIVWIKFFLTSILLALFIIGECIIALVVILLMLPKVVFDQLVTHYRETFNGRT